MRNFNLLLTIRGQFPIVAVGCLMVAAATGAQDTDPGIDVPAPSLEYEQWLDTLQNGSVPQRVRAVSNLPAVDDESLILPALQMAADAAWVELRTAAIFAIGKLGDMSAAPKTSG